MSSGLKTQLMDAMKAAMKSGDKKTLGTIRLMLAALKQIEVDERIDGLDDTRVIAVLDKMLKQRRESIGHYAKADRNDLVEQEQFEIEVLLPYLPKALDDAEIQQMIDAAITETGAASMKDMGKVMGILKPKMQGRADMSAISTTIRQKLSG